MSTLVNISEAASLGLHTMALMATDSRRRFTNQEVAERLQASSHHLAKVMQRLARAGLVNSVRGPQGGFLLGRAAEEITLLDVYEAVEGPVERTGCLFGEPVCDGTGCILGEAVQSIHKQLRDYLDKTTLAELSASLNILPPAAKQEINP